jgi:DNA-binding response OmpR family regulator
MNVPAPEARGAALIVAADREDRRVLFDALDAQAFEEIYSAQDISQARSFLAPDLDIDVVLLEFDEQPDEALAFCEELRKQSRRALPVIGLLGSRGGSWRDGRLPAGLVEWIARPV